VDHRFGFGMPDLFREDLAREAVGGHLLLFLRWASYYLGTEIDGQWCPDDDISDDAILALIAELRDDQLDELSYRLMIPWRFPSGGREPVEDAQRVYLGSHGASIVYNPVTLATCYRLALGAIYLLPGDLEVLAVAGFPSAPDRMLAALWHRLAPREPREHPFVTLCQRRTR
jgi:hypothetical protein